MPRGLVRGGPCSCMSKGNLPDEQPIAFTVRKTRFFGQGGCRDVRRTRRGEGVVGLLWGEADDDRWDEMRES